MKEFEQKPVPKNTFTLSNAEIAVVHALCCYFPEGMTKKAERVTHKLQEQLILHDAVGTFTVWKR